MLYLLDANVLIDANRDYYPISRVPEFWEWLIDHGIKDRVKIATEIFEEINKEKADLTLWLQDRDNKAALLLDEEVDVSLVSSVVEQGYSHDLTDDEIETLGRDPFLIAYAMVSPEDRCVVTTERSKPKRVGANRHIPDVCRDLGIQTCDTFEFVRQLDFRTGWRSR